MNNVIMNQKARKMTTVNIILLITAISTALITGLWYAYSCSVNLGLGRLADKEYISAMQSINKEILNPIFFAGFLGALLLLPISAWMNYGQPGSSRFVLLLIASLVYTIGVFGVTSFGNVPLNDALGSFDLQSASAEQIAARRANFEGSWNKLHNIRAIASLISLILVLIACMNTSNYSEAK